MQYSTQPHCSTLTGLVTSIWCYQSTSAHAFENVQPGVASQLLINLYENQLRHWTNPQTILRSTGPVAMQGILTTPVLIDTQQKRNVCGVAFSSFGQSLFCDESATRFTDNLIDTVDLWGQCTVDLRNDLLNCSDPAKRCQLIEQFLVDRLAIIRNKNEVQTENELIEKIVTLIRSGINLAAIRKTFNLSQRALHNLFDRRIGVRPKTFARIDRFSSSLAQLTNNKSISDVALNTGYSDQAHFTREFRSFTGNTPTRHQAIEHESRHAYTNLQSTLSRPDKKFKKSMPD